jgi:hypothetical protein
MAFGSSPGAGQLDAGRDPGSKNDGLAGDLTSPKRSHWRIVITL